MTALMSTKAGVFPGTAGSHTEVPATAWSPSCASARRCPRPWICSRG